MRATSRQASQKTDVTAAATVPAAAEAAAAAAVKAKMQQKPAHTRPRRVIVDKTIYSVTTKLEVARCSFSKTMPSISSEGVKFYPFLKFLPSPSLPTPSPHPIPHSPLLPFLPSFTDLGTESRWTGSGVLLPKDLGNLTSDLTHSEFSDSC